MQLSFDERTVRVRTCEHCGRRYDHVTAFVKSERGAYAVYYAWCHGHPEHEAGIDVVLGGWGGGDPASRVTFSCRLRADGAMAVDAPIALSDVPPLMGQTLTREQALAHPWLGAFWEVVDFIAAEDDRVREALVGAGSGDPERLRLD